LPVEIPYLAAALFARDDGQAGLFEAKRAAECTDAWSLCGSLRRVRLRAPGAGRGNPLARAGRRTAVRIAPSIIEGRAAILYLNLETAQFFESGG
jgi:hypothetical protein